MFKVGDRVRVKSPYWGLADWFWGEAGVVTIVTNLGAFGYQIDVLLEDGSRVSANDEAFDKE